ncbi:MAG: acyl carrier protein phosphodiesterase, partial [Polaribacter sp.]
ILPEKTLQILPYLIEHNWLYNYQYLEGIKTVLEGMNRRTKGKSKMDMAIDDLKNLYTEFEQDFTLFFEDLRIFSNQKLLEIISI